jgi:spore maturation protein CgeB
MTIVIMGNTGETHVAHSLLRAAHDMRLPATLFGAEAAWSSFRILNALSWRLRDKLPPFDALLERRVLNYVKGERSGILITTGLTPFKRRSVETSRDLGVVCLHFSTDDPWNPSHKARWHHDALKSYDIVFTSRRRNIDDLLALPCRQVHYLPFAYDPHLIDGSGGQTAFETEVLFVGGADNDRACFFGRYLAAGGPIKLDGAYWEQYRELRPATLGRMPPDKVAAMTRSAKVNLVLVRRANRDGHVMRSFEAAALGGCLAVEHTDEHQEIFGSDGETVRFFRSPQEAAAVCGALLRDGSERARLSSREPRPASAHRRRPQ